MSNIPCPFKYANGRRCPGHVVRVEAYKADLEWRPGEDGKWKLSNWAPRSHFHLFCSEKGNHAGLRSGDSERMKFWLDDLPDDIRKVIAES